MTVDDLRASELDAGVERSVRVRWQGGEQRVAVVANKKFTIKR